MLSGLVFPGLGQIFLKHYKRAAVIILTVFGSLALVIVKATQLALAILEKVESEGRFIDMESITEATSQAAVSILTINLGFLLIILCWIIGTVDAYRIGKKKDKEDRSFLNYKI